MFLWETREKRLETKTKSYPNIWHAVLMLDRFTVDMSEFTLADDLSHRSRRAGSPFWSDIDRGDSPLGGHAPLSASTPVSYAPVGCHPNNHWRQQPALLLRRTRVCCFETEAARRWTNSWVGETCTQVNEGNVPSGEEKLQKRKFKKPV